MSARLDPGAIARIVELEGWLALRERDRERAFDAWMSTEPTAAKEWHARLRALLELDEEIDLLVARLNRARCEARGVPHLRVVR